MSPAVQVSKNLESLSFSPLQKWFAWFWSQFFPFTCYKTDVLVTQVVAAVPITRQALTNAVSRLLPPGAGCQQSGASKGSLQGRGFPQTTVSPMPTLQ